MPETGAGATRHVSRRVAGMRRSATVAMVDIVADRRARGESVVDLSGGEPDAVTPGHVVDGAVAALREGFTHYTSSRGIPELRAAVAEKLRRDNDVPTDPDRVLVTASAKHALFVAFMTLLDPGDEIVVPGPAWVSYGAMAALAGATAVAAPLAADDGFRLTRAALERAAGPRTRAVLVNSPNNPTGRVLDDRELDAVVGFAADRDLVIVADEIYERLVHPGSVHRSVAAVPGAAARTVTVNGFSKGYAMTGWRLGYLTGPAELVAEMLKVQEHTVSCATSFVQRGAVAALTGDQEPVAAMLRTYTARRDAVCAAVAAMPGIRCTPPEGAFYAFLDVRDSAVPDAARFVEYAASAEGLMLTPGTAFGPGGEGHVRMSVAAHPDVLSDGLARLHRVAARSPSATAVPG